jgi:hypothetical protein
MSYDLSFWRYERGVQLDHRYVYQQLSDGITVDGLERLPIDELLAEINQAFHGWEKLDDATFESSDRGSFQIYATPHYLAVTCYGMRGDDVNKFIEIAHEFGCPLYDPQVDKRFE